MVSGSRSPERAIASRAHLAQRIEHAGHGPARQRSVAHEGGGEGMRGGDSHGETHAGAGIAEIDDALRLEQAARAEPADAPGRVASALDRRPEGAHGGGRCHDVGALEQAGDAGLADGQRAEHQRAVRDRLVARRRHPACAAGLRERRSEVLRRNGTWPRRRFTESFGKRKNGAVGSTGGKAGHGPVRARKGV